MSEPRIITRPRDNYRFVLTGSHLGTKPAGSTEEPYRHPGCPGCEKEETE